MNLRKIAVQLFVMLSLVTAVHAADFQQVQLKGPKDANEQFSGTVYGPIKSSDTLWQIAQRARQNPRHSIYQVMQAIYELNPDAFEEQNINLIKNGSMLRLPSERYVSRVNVIQAREKAERDSQSFQPNSTSPQASTAPTVPSSQQQAQANAEKLEQTTELIEQKLGAMDEEQNRQFMAIRKQFAESISSVQSILDENKKLFERLDKVNTDIDEMREQEQQKSQKINQMGESIEELLEKSRLDEAKRAAEKAEQDASWLDSPLALIMLGTLPVLLILAGFAYWILKRKGAGTATEDDNDDLTLDPLTAEMDDLSDALSAELAEDSTDELDDDNLFGDDDLLDDVLAEELEESLDEALEDSIEEPLVGDSGEFDDLGDDGLDGELDDEFEVGAEVVEQDDLDSLFDEDDDELSTADDSQDDADLEEMLIEEDEQQVDSEIDDMEYEEDESLLAPVEADDEALLAPVNDEGEQPEISIDDILDEAAEPVIENPLADDSEDINEEVLQNLDKEIASQNEELDSVTGSLIDELEQVEQMRSMMPDDEEDEETELGDDAASQMDIQQLDGLAEEVDEDLLADDEDGAEQDVEVDISAVLPEAEPLLTEDELVEASETEQLTPTQESAEPELEDKTDKASATETQPPPAHVRQDTDETAALAETESVSDPEAAAELAENPKPEQAPIAAELPEPELEVETEDTSDIEALAQSASEEQEAGEASPLGEAESVTDSESAAEKAVTAEPETPPELATSVDEPGEENQAEMPEKSSAADLVDEAAAPAEASPEDEAQESVQPQPSADLEDLAEAVPESVPELDVTEPSESKRTDDADKSVESEQTGTTPEPELDPRAEAPAADDSAEVAKDLEVVATDEPTERAESEPDDESQQPAQPEPEDALDGSSEATRTEQAESEPADNIAEPEPAQQEEELESLAESAAELEPQDATASQTTEPPPESSAATQSDTPVGLESEDELESPSVADDPDKSTESASSQQLEEDDELAELEQALDEDFAEPEFEESASSNSSTLDEDQLEKALEDFEKEEFDQVLEDLTSNETASISSLDDLEFSADDFVTKDESVKPAPTADAVTETNEPSDEFDDSELDLAFDEDETSEQLGDKPGYEPLHSENADLDDLPGLGDWLDSDDVKVSDDPSETSKDAAGIEDLEESSFDEILESIDSDHDLSAEAENDTGFDIPALLDESALDEEIEFSGQDEQDEQDFLDVETLLNDSVGAESDEELDKALDLDLPLEPFVNDQDELEMIDVDADDGLGAKLDLAHAYIEIGEEESAKELLDEVLQKGSPKQVAQAQAVLDNLD